MVRGLFKGLSALTSGVVGTAASAQHVYVPAGRWTVDVGDVRCSLARRLGDANSPILMLTSYLGKDDPQFILMQDGTQEPPSLGRRVTVTLSPGGQAQEGQVVRRRTATPSYLITGLPEGYFDRFGAAQSIRFSSRDRTYFDLQLPGAARAIRVLRDCNDQLLRNWGIDTVARDRLRREPERIAGTIQDEDYPSEALRRSNIGTTVVVLLIGTDGRISRCSIAVSSGSPVLDTTVCNLMTERFRYRPALDERGQVVPMTQVQSVTWQM